MSLTVKTLTAVRKLVNRDIAKHDRKLEVLSDKQEQAEHVHSLRLALARTEYDDAVARAAKRYNATVNEADSDYTDQTDKLDRATTTAAGNRRRLGRLARHLNRALDEHEEDVQLTSN